ncbi:hypothetical protein Tco_0241247, partial [Tanacetum coccineum]
LYLDCMKDWSMTDEVGFLKKPEESAGFAEIVDFLKGSHIRYAWTHNPTIHDSLVKQFWQTATASTLANGTLELRATIDTIKYTITESFVRKDQGRIIQDINDDPLVSKGDFVTPTKEGFRGVHRPLLPAMLPVVAIDQSAGPADQAEDQPSSSAPLPSSSHPLVISATIASELHMISYSPHVLKAKSMTVEDLLHLVPNLITKVDSLETELKQTKLTMGKAIVKLVKKVKKLEDILKRRHVVLTDSEDEEPEDQGRIIQDIDDDPLDISTGFEEVNTGFEEVNTGFEKVNTGGLGVSTGFGPVSSARAKGKKSSNDIGYDSIRAKLKANAELTKNVTGKSCPEEDFATERWSRTTKAQLKRYGEELQTEILKKQRIDDKDVSVEEKVTEVKEEEPTDEEESVKAMNRTPLDIKSNIMANWKIFQQAMPYDFTREDLFELYMLVMQKYGTNRPEDAYDRVLWSDLRTMFDPPLNEDAIWSLPLQQKIISLRRCDGGDGDVGVVVASVGWWQRVEAVAVAVSGWCVAASGGE